MTKKLVIGAAVVAVCGAIAWGYVQIKAAILTPAVPVQRALGPYCVVFGPEHGASERRKGAADDVRERLKAHGVTAQTTIIMWMTSAGMSRDGAVIAPADAPKARGAGRDLTVATLPRQTAWVHESAGKGTIGMALGSGPGMLGLVNKAQELKLSAYVLVFEIADGAMTAGLLKPPR